MKPGAKFPGIMRGITGHIVRIGTVRVQTLFVKGETGFG